LTPFSRARERRDDAGHQVDPPDFVVLRIGHEDAPRPIHGEARRRADLRESRRPCVPGVSVPPRPGDRPDEAAREVDRADAVAVVLADEEGLLPLQAEGPGDEPCRGGRATVADDRPAAASRDRLDCPVLLDPPDACVVLVGDDHAPRGVEVDRGRPQ
jgi:hypothetical protein